MKWTRKDTRNPQKGTKKTRLSSSLGQLSGSIGQLNPLSPCSTRSASSNLSPPVGLLRLTSCMSPSPSLLQTQSLLKSESASLLIRLMLCGCRSTFASEATERKSVELFSFLACSLEVFGSTSRCTRPTQSFQHSILFNALLGKNCCCPLFLQQRKSARVFILAPFFLTSPLTLLTISDKGVVSAGTRASQIAWTNSIQASFAVGGPNSFSLMSCKSVLSVLVYASQRDVILDFTDKTRKSLSKLGHLHPFHQDSLLDAVPTQKTAFPSQTTNFPPCPDEVHFASPWTVLEASSTFLRIMQLVCQRQRTDQVAVAAELRWDSPKQDLSSNAISTICSNHHTQTSMLLLPFVGEFTRQMLAILLDDFLRVSWSSSASDLASSLGSCSDSPCTCRTPRARRCCSHAPTLLQRITHRPTWHP